MKIIGFYGRKGVGKNYVSDICCSTIKEHDKRWSPNLNNFIISLAFADPIKSFIVENLGIDKNYVYGNDRDKMNFTVYSWEKMPNFVMETNRGKSGQMTVRDVMQVFGTELNRSIWDENIWIHSMYKKICEYSKMGTEYFLITDVRFDNEVQAIRKWGGEIWTVLGKQRIVQSNSIDKHASENINNEVGDFFIFNDIEGTDSKSRISKLIFKRLGLD